MNITWPIVHKIGLNSMKSQSLKWYFTYSIILVLYDYSNLVCSQVVSLSPMVDHPPQETLETCSIPWTLTPRKPQIHTVVDCHWLEGSCRHRPLVSAKFCNKVYTDTVLTNGMAISILCTIHVALYRAWVYEATMHAKWLTSGWQCVATWVHLRWKDNWMKCPRIGVLPLKLHGQLSLFSLCKFNRHWLIHFDCRSEA